MGNGTRPLRWADLCELSSPISDISPIQWNPSGNPGPRCSKADYLVGCICRRRFQP
jgi:hypothetical protein